MFMNVSSPIIRTAYCCAVVVTIFALVTMTMIRPDSAAASAQGDSAAVTFSNSAPIVPADRPSNTAGTDPGMPPAGSYPSTISVAGLSGPITKVTVSFAITSTWPDDLDILLVGPTGVKVLLMSDAGNSGNVTARTLVFDQAAATEVPDTGTDANPLPAGTYRPTNLIGFATPEPGGQDNFPQAGGLQAFPAQPSLDDFNGTDPNGTWSLYVVDDQAIDTSSLPSGWSIDITAGAPVATATISGRVTNAAGAGIRKAHVTVTGGGLAAPRLAITNGFGYYSVPALPIPQSYTVTVSGKGYTFASPTQVVDLNANAVANFTSSN